MTEQEWQKSADPNSMLAFLNGKVSNRKMRLFAIACCRRIWNDFGSYEQVIAVGEAFADGSIPQERMERTAGLYQSPPDAGSPDCASLAILGVLGPLTSAVELTNILAQIKHVIKTDPHKLEAWYWPLIGKAHAALVREIFGYPCRAWTVDPRWLTSTVVALAQAIYDDRAFERMPILADALEDAGCINTEILAHCRGPGPHVRGCWVVDLLLGNF
jgi:hypothetical protein